ncbi:MAG: efflux RND transporter permease subunit, partial [Bdellovibrionales bacterium]|nr:efflux RND transporter permease subunit [Bdellovibrionales bacterium]
KVTDAVRVNQHIQKMLPKFNERYPNLKVIFGGENEDTQESMRSLMRTFGLAFVGIFIVLILLFQQMWQPILVGLTIPLGAISVMITLFLHREPLSFMGMLGVIALSGVIVNNAIVLVDCVNQLRRGGAELIESIVKAATMRLRPIFLTTVTTVVGILPTAYGIGGQDEFVKPIALALGWGLLLGSTLTVFIFPSMIAILDDFIRKLKGFFVSAK